MNKPDGSSWDWSGLGLSLLVTLIAISFLYSPGTEDLVTWHYWMGETSYYGLIGGFANSSAAHPHDYPPLAFVILATVSQASIALGVSKFIALKCSLLLFLLATSICFYWFTRNFILTAALEFALLLNSVALGYLDIYVAPLLIAGLFFLGRGNLNLGLVLFAGSCFIKWQPLIIAPFVCLYIWVSIQDDPSWRKKLQRQIMPFAITTLAVALPICAIFGLPVISSLQRAMSHAYLSGLALNLSWLYTWALHVFEPEKFGPLQDGQISLIIADDTLLKLPEKILFFASYAVVLIAFLQQPKTFERLIRYAILGYMCYFIFNTGVHENHLFVVVCLAWILVFLNSADWLNGVNLSLAANINPVLFYGFFGTGLSFSRVIAGVDITLLFAIANICLFGGMLGHTFRADGVSWRFWRPPAS